MSPQTAPVRSRLPRIAEQAVQRARLTVVPRRTRPRTRVPFVILVSVVLVGGVVGLLMLNTTMQQNAFHATALEKEAEALTAKQEGLEMELARLNDPQQVAERALALGMVEANVADYVDLSTKAIVPSGAAAATPENRMRINPPPQQKPPALAPPPIVVRDRQRERDTGATSSDRSGNAGRNGEDTSRRAARSAR